MGAGHAIQWVAPSPLWVKGKLAAAKMRQPALLRFASDDFMKEFAAQLASAHPEELAAMVAQWESNRASPLGAPADWKPTSDTPDAVKLYQPTHGRFYLVAASLVCQLPGLPDHGVNSTKAEKVSFVVRRVADATAPAFPNVDDELAWVKDPATGRKYWKALSPAERSVVGADEDVFAMFPTLYPESDRKRRVFAGLIPTSSRETFESAAVLPTTQDLGEPGGPGDPRLSEFDARVTTAFNQLPPITTHSILGTVLEDVIFGTGPTGDSVADKQRLDGSSFLLLDLAEFLAKYLKPVWEALNGRATPPASSEASGQLYTALSTKLVERPVEEDPAPELNPLDTVSPQPPKPAPVHVPRSTKTWKDALVTAWNEALILSGDTPGTPSPSPDISLSELPPDDVFDDSTPPQLIQVGLRTLIQNALAATPFPGGDPTALLPNTLTVPKLDPTSVTRYRIRCVYRRPNCGPLEPDVVSEPSDRFVIAQFFDFDAPQRPVRIPLPIDTSVAGLRKFKPSVGFLLSAQLRQQMCRAVDMKKLLIQRLDSCTEPSLGEICSFSIPIITIAAIILMMIMVSLLNIIFWWMPFLKLCFPVGKGSK